MDDDIIKGIAGAFLGVLMLFAAIYFTLFILLPVGVVAGGWWAYKIYQGSPGTRAKRDLKQAALLQSAIIENQGKLPTANEFAYSVYEALVSDRAPSYELATAIFQLASDLYTVEGLTETPSLPTASTEIDRARQLDHLSALASRLSRPDAVTLLRDAMISALRDFLSTLPAFIYEPKEKVLGDLEAEKLQAQYAVPLIDIVAKPGLSIEALILPFYQQALFNAGLFGKLREQFDRNQHEVSNLPYTMDFYQSPKLIAPTKNDDAPIKLVDGYLRHTPFQALFRMMVPIEIPQALRFEGTWIVAPTGTGKTTLLSSMLKGDLEEVKRGEASVIVMDSKGELTSHLSRLKRFAPGGDLEGKLVLIEPSSNLAINPIDLGASMGHTIGLIEYLFSFGTETTDKQSTLFRSILIALGSIPNASFATFRTFIRDGWLPFQQYIEKLHPDDRDFFMKPGATGVSEYDDKDYVSTKRELLWRVQDLTTRVPLLRDMFRAPKTLIDLGAEMDAGKVIVIDNSTRTLDTVGSEFLGRLFLALIRGQAEQREGRTHKLPCYVYLDECDTVIARDENVNTILTKCRSQKIGLILAHQKLIDITSDRVKAALRDCGVRFANVDDEASEMAARMRSTPEALRTLSKGQFALFMRRMEKSLTVRVANDPISSSSWPKMSDVDFKGIQAQMQRFSFTPAPPAPEPVVQPNFSEPDTSPVQWPTQH